MAPPGRCKDGEKNVAKSSAVNKTPSQCVMSRDDINERRLEAKSRRIEGPRVVQVQQSVM